MPDSYLRFVLQPRKQGRRTDNWQIISTRGHHLGTVHWWTHWRQYVFEPDPACVFNKDCLLEIAAFCESETVKRR